MLGAVCAGAQLLLMEGIRRTPASVAAPLEFSALVWALAFGYLIWDDIRMPPCLSAPQF
jgi:drug/metabolite transporter (DMT)-like permease